MARIPPRFRWLLEAVGALRGYNPCNAMALATITYAFRQRHWQSTACPHDVADMIERARGFDCGESP